MAEPIEKEQVPVKLRSLKVESALKAVIESELARGKVAGTKVLDGVAFFSRGVIFSKSGNGTPFSRGIIFSKSGSELGRPNENPVLQTLTAMDEAAFHSFASRLTTLKQTKIAGEVRKSVAISEVRESQG